MATYQTTDRSIDTICIMGNDTINWNEIVQSVPNGIAAMSQLLISASRASDFQINQIDNDKIPLVRHPESFRKTLEQIANDYYNAFHLANTNMENIQLQMGQVPGYIRDSIEIIQRRNSYLHRILVYWGYRPSLKEDLPNQLKKIKTAADNGLKMSTEVAEAFNKLGQLNQQVLLAITASHGAREREIEDAVHAKMKEEMDCRLKATEFKQLNIQRQLEDARREVRSRQQELEEVCQFEVGGVIGLILFGVLFHNLQIALEMSESNARNALHVAEERLQQLKQQAKRAEEERENIYDEYSTERLRKMHVDVEKDKSRDEMIRLLKEAMSQLSQLNSNWAGFTQNFNSINNYIEQVTQRTLTDFVEDAAQEDTSKIDFSGPINKALECSKKTHHTAKMYVEFSNNQIMKSINDMQRCKNLPSC